MHSSFNQSRAPATRVHVRPPRLRTVRSNALGPLDGKDGGEEDMGGYEEGFERDTAAAISKVMTAKATQHVLIQLGQTNLVKCQWLNNFAADNSPMKGDAFITALLTQAPSTVTNPHTGSTEEVSPQALGRRVLSMREELGKNVAKLLPQFVHEANMTVLREHLVSTSSGDTLRHPAALMHAQPDGIVNVGEGVVSIGGSTIGGTSRTGEKWRRGQETPLSDTQRSMRRTSRRQGR